MNPKILNYVALMVYNHQQNPWGTVVTMLLTALPQSLVSRAMILVNWPTVGA